MVFPFPPRSYAQRTSPNTQTARPSGTSRTGAATPSAATTKMIPAAILVTRPIGMVGPPHRGVSSAPEIHHLAEPMQHAPAGIAPYTGLTTSRGAGPGARLARLDRRLVQGPIQCST